MVSQIIGLSYDMRLPYESFWGAVNNILLLQFAEVMDDQVLIDMTYCAVMNRLKTG